VVVHQPTTGPEDRARLIPDSSAPLPTGDDKRQAVQAMFDTIAPRYDLVNRIMTFRLDVRWRRIALRTLHLPAGSVVADLASGTGDLCVELAKAGLRPISVDLSFGMLAADRSGSPRVQGDNLRLPFPDASLDGITCGFALRNFTDLGAFFDELGRVVRPGGRVALLDAATPSNPVLRFGHGIYFGKVVPRIGGLLSNKEAYAYLPRSLAYLPPPVVMVDRLRRAGFDDVERRLLSGGIAQLFTGSRRP
jgi:demethylmenaquinone methyltransferase/2-methoxy-6-polyprenyl-1,4-benzoquinol methylase